MKISFLIIVLFLLAGLFAPWLAPHDPSSLDNNALNLPPFFINGGSVRFPLGTDDLGRDTLSRLIYGARISIGIGLAIVLVSTVVGGLLGIFSGYAGGVVDSFIMRAVDIVMAFPSILLAIMMVSVLQVDIVNVVLAVSIVAIPHFVRIMRASVMAEKQKDYVAASTSFGAGHLRIMFRAILPNATSPIIVQMSLCFSEGILTAAALGFLGLGVAPPTPEWGVMLADARPFIQSNPWMVTFPGLCLLALSLSFNICGDRLRDAMDPRLKE